MLLPVRYLDAGCAKWTILDMQGSVVARDGESVAGLEIGSLSVKNVSARPQARCAGGHLSRSQGVPELVIGSQRLVGAFKKLAKPLAVLQKNRGDDGVEYEVLVVIREKITFTTRPKPIVRRTGLTSVR